ncbi:MULTISPECIES: hypothetical protein [Flavobacterium]|uniref:hypothetical protein n=1 Tax=Flavobacterium TaxID=237 RepID=UPI0021156F93|nr:MULTISPECIES: hypothetical protein [Flavobacterium]UUF16887.1 hypothetical protein NLJ00_12375 [Flavobacterium panici]
MSAKRWFKNYEAEGTNYELFQNLDYDWNNAEITKSEDGTKTIIVPINEIKKDPTENWEQKLYIYKLGENNYQALLFEIYPDSKNTDPESSSIDSGIFTGYIAAWDLKKGFVKAALFENGKVAQNGSIKVYSKNKAITGKAPSNQANCPAGIECDTDGSGDTGTELKEVVVNNNYQNPSGYVIIYNNGGGGYTGDTSPGGYTNHGTGTSSGTENTQDTNNATTNPCDKIKTLMANPNFIVKLEELGKKTNLKVESGYSQSKNGPFTPLIVLLSTDGADKMKLIPTPDMVGYVHTHLNDYDSGLVNADGEPLIRKPLRIFSPVDIGAFLQLVKNAQNNNIPIDNVYGAMVSSDGTYQLRFTGDPNQININFDWDATSMEKDYMTYLEKGNKEVNFLRFLNDKCYIKGIELYKINKDKTSTKKTLDTKKTVININC